MPLGVERGRALSDKLIPANYCRDEVAAMANVAPSLATAGMSFAEITGPGFKSRSWRGATASAAHGCSRPHAPAKHCLMSRISGGVVSWPIASRHKPIVAKLGPRPKAFARHLPQPPVLPFWQIGQPKPECCQCRSLWRPHRAWPV
jgi:hypothetical protein